MASIGPAMPPSLAASAKRRHGENTTPMTSNPSLPGHVSTSEHDQPQKRARVVGPTLPPSALGERPTSPNNSGSDSDDDDFGPALPPPKGGALPSNELHDTASTTQGLDEHTLTRPQRESWMLAPPDADSWSTRVDPTKLRNRKFNAGKGAKAPPQSTNHAKNLWTETTEEKTRRLRDEMMGAKKVAGMTSNATEQKAEDAEAQATEQRIREYNAKNRDTSLYAQHAKTESHEEEDDPSKRAFDKEKDIRGGATINSTKRKELLSKAADFGTRFSKGKYL